MIDKYRCSALERLCPREHNGCIVQTAGDSRCHPYCIYLNLGSQKRQNSFNPISSPLKETSAKKQVFYSSSIFTLKDSFTARKEALSKSVMALPFRTPGTSFDDRIPSTLNEDEHPSHEVESNEDFHYEPLATSPSGYDTDIDDISDLDPNDPVALRDFSARIGPSESAFLETRSPPETGYDADDEDSGSSKEAFVVESADQDGDILMINYNEAAGDSDHERMRVI